MSYIRAISNPEGLYVWSDEHGMTNFSWNVKAPLARGTAYDGRGMIVPRKTFEKATRRWGNNEFDSNLLSVEGFTIQFHKVELKTGKPIPEAHTLRAMLRKRSQCEFLIRISYKKAFVHMWEVAWNHIVNNVMGRP